jgi:hypothetical protein
MPVGPISGALPSPISPADFHRQYVRTLAVRFLNSQQAAARVSQAFQLFEQDALGLPARLPGIPSGGTGSGSAEPVRFRGGGSITGGGSGLSAPLVGAPVGNTPANASLADVFNNIVYFTDVALETFVERSNNVRQSQQNGPHYTPLAQLSLIPYAEAQIARVAEVFRATPPAFDPRTGALLNAEARRATEAAFSNIINAVAEYSVHPNLFLNPGDFYVLTTYTLPYTGTPAKEAGGFFILGPGGQPLPGAGALG